MEKKGKRNQKANLFHAEISSNREKKQNFGWDKFKSDIDINTLCKDSEKQISILKISNFLKKPELAVHKTC